jgi:hypothetical protein
MIDHSTILDDKWRLVWSLANQTSVGIDLSGADLHGPICTGSTCTGRC